MSGQKPIPLDIPAALKSLAEITAVLTALQKQQEQQSAPVSTVEPTTLTGAFTSASSELHRAHAQFSAVIDRLFAAAPLNNQLAILLATMKQDSERFQRNLEANTLNISGEIHGFEHVEPKAKPPLGDDEWWKGQP